MIIRIKQHGKVITFFGSGNAKSITEHLSAKVEEYAGRMKDAGKMETGYYDAELSPNLSSGIVHDHAIFVA